MRDNHRVAPRRVPHPKIMGISSHGHLTTTSRRCREIFNVCSPTVLRPVGRKCPQGTPTLRVTVTVFIRRRHVAYRPSRRAATFLMGGARPRHYALNCGTPRLRARLRFRCHIAPLIARGKCTRYTRPLQTFCTAALHPRLPAAILYARRSVRRGSRRRFASPRGCAFHTPPHL